MNLPGDLLYCDTHEWVRDEGNGVVTIGITDHAQSTLGDIVYVELPEVDGAFDKGDEFGVVESVKAASDLYIPVSGTVTEVNSELNDAPEQINSDPYGNGWIAKVKLDDEGDLKKLLSADGYEEFLENEAE